ncbi:unnamed protein product, partial [Brenthis ino]
MKLLVVFFALLALAIAAPTVGKDLAALRALPALLHEEVHDELGQFALRYVTAEGIVVYERGRLVPSENGTEYVLVLEGEISYIGDDGKTYVTKYTADLGGNNVVGNHLPKVPEPVVA